jgi:hypothetical protein
MNNVLVCCTIFCVRADVCSSAFIENECKQKENLPKYKTKKKYTSIQDTFFLHFLFFAKFCFSNCPNPILKAAALAVQNGPGKIKRAGARKPPCPSSHGPPYGGRATPHPEIPVRGPSRRTCSIRSSFRNLLLEVFQRNAKRNLQSIRVTISPSESFEELVKIRKWQPVLGGFVFFVDLSFLNENFEGFPLGWKSIHFVKDVVHL